METPVEYTITAHELASCDRPERLAILYQVKRCELTPEEADKALERLTEARILAAQRGMVEGWMGDDRLPLAEERSAIAKTLYGDGEDEL